MIGPTIAPCRPGFLRRPAPRRLESPMTYRGPFSRGPQMKAAGEIHPHDDFDEDRSGRGVRAHLCVKSVGDPTAVTPVADVRVNPQAWLKGSRVVP